MWSTARCARHRSVVCSGFLFWGVFPSPSRTWQAHMSAKGLTDLMESRFKQLDQDNVPFLIREHARKFQWGCSHLTVWQRR